MCILHVKCPFQVQRAQKTPQQTGKGFGELNPWALEKMVGFYSLHAHPQPSLKCSQESPAPNQDHVAPPDTAPGLPGIPEAGTGTTQETGNRTFLSLALEPDPVRQGNSWNSPPSFWTETWSPCGRWLHSSPAGQVLKNSVLMILLWLN